MELICLAQKLSSVYHLFFTNYPPKSTVAYKNALNCHFTYKQ